jgi:alpha-beta hydrolase superfamily lysophospholipase
VTGNHHELPLRKWLPKKKLKAIIIALHGFNDYSFAFDGAGQFLKEEGVGVIAYDQQGFGKNQPQGIWAGEDNLTTDLKQIVIATNRSYPNVPVYLLGESMGGAVVTAAIVQPNFPEVSGIILSAPALWGSETMSPLYELVLWTMAHTVPSKTLTGEGLKIQASDNIQMLIAMANDEHIVKETRVDAVYGVKNLMDSASMSIPAIKYPTLLLYGANDQVIPAKPIILASERMNGNLTAVYYPEGYHLLLRDLQSEIVLNDIAHWVLNPDNPIPSGNHEAWHELVSNTR